MVVLGLLLLAASVGIGGYIAGINTDSLTFDAFGQTYTSDMWSFFLIGAALGALAVLGLWLMLAGLRRARRRHVEDKEVVMETRSRVDELADENAALRDELARQRSITEEAATRTPVVETGVMGAGERDTILTRDGDGIADRSEPAYAGGTVYPDDPPSADRETPAFDETASGTKHRTLFGRSRER
jgi:hypothetical protein